MYVIKHIPTSHTKIFSVYTIHILLNAHWAGHSQNLNRPQKSEIWELELSDRSSRPRYAWCGWLVSDTVDGSSRLLKKSLNKNSKLAQLMYVQETVSMVLCTTTWSGCAVLLESEQTPFLRQVVYLDRCSGFYSELSDLFLYLLQDQEMMESLRQAMCAALVCNKFL